MLHDALYTEQAARATGIPVWRTYCNQSPFCQISHSTQHQNVIYSLSLWQRDAMQARPAVARCPSVCPSVRLLRSWILSKRVIVSSHFFTVCSQTIIVFAHQTLWRYIDGDPLNPLDSRGNYSGTSNNTKLIHWPLMGGLLHLVQRGGGLGGLRPRPIPSPLYQSLYCYMMVRCSAVLMWLLKG